VISIIYVCVFVGKDGMKSNIFFCILSNSRVRSDWSMAGPSNFCSELCCYCSYCHCLWGGLQLLSLGGGWIEYFIQKYWNFHWGSCCLAGWVTCFCRRA